MAYRNKTYVIFDGDKDIWAWGFMKGWRSNSNIEFDFIDAHDLFRIREGSQESTVKRRLRERMANAKLVIVLVGEGTRHLYKYVRWELELALELELPIIVANLNETRGHDDARCPPLLDTAYAVHVPFKLAILQHAIDQFPSFFDARARGATGPLAYPASLYTTLGL